MQKNKNKNEKNKNEKRKKWIKIVFFAALLIGAGYLFGVVCKQFDQAYNLILSASIELLNPLLWFLLGLFAVVVAAGLVSALLRPIWIGVTAFGLSGLAMLLGWWHLTIGSGLLVLIYFLAGIIYILTVKKELNLLIKFSVQPICKSQMVLRIALILIICGSLYFGYAAHIKQEGFSIPEPYIEMIFEQIEKRVKTQVPAEEYQETVVNLREELGQAINNFSEQTIKPYERFIPLAIAIGLFTTLITITSLLTWIPAILLYIIFPLLKKSSMVKIVSETKDIQRLVIN